MAKKSEVNVTRLVKLSTRAVPALLLFSQSCKAVSGSPLGFAPHLPGLPRTATLSGGQVQPCGAATSPNLVAVDRSGTARLRNATPSMPIGAEKTACADAI